MDTTATQYVIVTFQGIGSCGLVDGWSVDTLRNAWKRISFVQHNKHTSVGISRAAKVSEIKKYLKNGFCGWNTNC